MINIFNENWTNRSEVLAGVGKISPGMIRRNRPYLYMCIVGANGGVSRKSHKAAFEGIIREAGFTQIGKAQRIFDGSTVFDGKFERAGRSYDIHILRRSRSETAMVIGVLP